MISKIILGAWPTPLVEAKNISSLLGAGRKLYIKRDDLCGLAFGGNKIRRMEYVLSEAVSTGCDCIVTGGGSTSNQICAVAACGARLGLETHIVYPETTPESTRILCRMLGAKVHTVPSGKDVDSGIRQVCRDLRSAGKKPFPVLQGAPNVSGLLGYVDAVQELLTQASEKGFSMDDIVCCGGTGNTYAGLLMGCKLYTPSTRVTAVSIGRRFTRPETIVKRISEASKLAHLNIHLDTSDVHTCFCAGKGYGAASPKGMDAMNIMAASEGVFLDPVYTGKAFAGLLQLNENDYFAPNSNIVFVHTGGMNTLMGHLKKDEV